MALSALDCEAGVVPPGSGNLILIPHLGGRVCPSQPHLRGTWMGFTWGHGQPQFYRSLLESVAYEYRYYLETYRELFPGTPPREVRVIGGGSKSSLWNQIKSDVLGVPLVTLNREEGATLGSAILAGVGVGLYKNITAVTQSWIREKNRFEPDPERHLEYQLHYSRYMRFLQGLDELYKNDQREAGF